MILFKSFEWKPHSGSERHEFKSSLCLLNQAQSVTYSLSRGKATAQQQLILDGRNLHRSCSARELSRKHFRRDQGPSSTAARRKRLLHWSSSALRLVTLMDKRQEEHTYVAKCNVVQRWLSSWRVEPKAIDSMPQHGKDFSSFTEELGGRRVSVVGY